MIVYLGLVMVLASVEIALSDFANWLETDALDLVSVLLLVGSSFVVASMILYTVVQSVGAPDSNASASP